MQGIFSFFAVVASLIGSLFGVHPIINASSTGVAPSTIPAASTSAPSGYSSTTFPVSLICSDNYLPSSTFVASKSLINSGDSITFTWDIPTSCATTADFSLQCIPDVTIHDVLKNQDFACGEMNRIVSSSGSYTLKFTNTAAIGRDILAYLKYEKGEVGARAAVSPSAGSAISAGAASITLEVNNSLGPITVAADDIFTLSWTSKNVTTCVGTGGWSYSNGYMGAPAPASGTKIWLEPQAGITQNYGLQCLASDGSMVKSNTVQVKVL